MKRESRVAVFYKTPKSIVVGIYRGKDLINVIIAKDLEEVLKNSKFMEVKYVEEGPLADIVSKKLGLRVVRRNLGDEVRLLALAISSYERAKEC